MDKQLELEQMQYASNKLVEQANQLISIVKLLRYPLNRCFELANKTARRQDSQLNRDQPDTHEMMDELFNVLQVVESLADLGLFCEDKASFLKAYFEGRVSR